MRPLRFALVSVASLALLLSMTASAALAAKPERFVISLDDPAIDADESAWASAFCDFDVDAQVSGHIIVLAFGNGEQRHVELDVYGTHVVYSNVATGAQSRLTDVGPDRIYVEDGQLYVAITGRSVTGSGVIGTVIVNLDTRETVFVAGNEVGSFYDGLCAAIG